MNSCLRCKSELKSVGNGMRGCSCRSVLTSGMNPHYSASEVVSMVTETNRIMNRKVENDADLVAIRDDIWSEWTKN